MTSKPAQRRPSLYLSRPVRHTDAGLRPSVYPPAMKAVVYDRHGDENVLHVDDVPTPELGACAAFNYRSEDFVERTLEITGGRGVDVVLDCIGAPYLDRNLSVLMPGGLMVVIGLMGGAKTELDLGLLLRRRLTLVGSMLRVRSADEKGRIIDRFLNHFGDAINSGTIAPVVDRVLPLERASEAHRLLAAGEIFGKIVLTME